MSKKNQNYTNRKQNRFQPGRMRGNVFVNNSGKQWLPGENGRAAKVERLLRGAKEEKKEIAGNQVYFPSGKFERGCFEGMRHVAKVSNVKELQKAMQNKNVREIYVYRDRDLDRRNLTRILEENDLGKTIYCGFNFDS